ncbi:MAG TPA: tetratricopeptide repeat protein [Kofleriaceae bacterium]
MSRAALVGFVLLASTAALADADKASIIDPFAKQKTSQSAPANRKRAAELSAQSAQHYKRGEFEVSAALLRQAYALYAEPNLLYNLARALEGMGDKAGAVDAYEKYLAIAKQIEDRGAIQRRVSTLKAELAAQTRPIERAEPPLASPSQPPVVEPAAQPPPVEPSPRITPPSKLPWIPIVGGIAVIGGGVGFGLQARNLEQMSIDEPNALDAKDQHDTARKNAMIANVLFAVGGAALVGGIVWEVLVLREQHQKTDLPVPRPVVSTRGIALEWTLP